MAEPLIENEMRWLTNQSNGAISFIVLAVLFSSLRVIGVGLLERKTIKAKSFNWESSLLLASLLAFLPLCVAAIITAHGYLAIYSVESSIEPSVNLSAELERYYIMNGKASYAFSVAFPVACALPKISICCMYLGLFRIDNYMRRTTKFLIAFLVVNAVAWLVPTVAVCHPINLYWSLEPHQSRCIDYNIFGTWISLPQILTDIFILCLPLPVLWKMQMRRSKKIGVSITFLAGSVGIFGGCLRLAFYIKRTYVDQPGTDETTQSIAASYIASYVEAGMYLIAACLPRLRSLIGWLYEIVSTRVSSVIPRREKAGISVGLKKGSEVAHINMKLTGVGAFESLA